jgi:hypothetical protein
MEWVLLSKESAERWEGSMVLGCLRIFDNYISVMDAGEEELPSFSAALANNTTNSQLQPPVIPFAGKGYKLGGNETQSNQRLKQSYTSLNDEEAKELQDL